MSLSDLLKIGAGNASLIYLHDRLSDPDYRGAHGSQHNRFDVDFTHDILSEFNSAAGPTGRMQIRTTDLSKRATNIPGEEKYAAFCSAVKAKTGRGTQDSIRKNLFVDWNRMGLIDRLNASGIIVGPNERAGKISFVQLTELGSKFVSATDPIRRRFIYSAAISKLLGDTVDDVLTVMEELSGKPITVYEYMFFASAIDDQAAFGRSRTQVVELLKSFRLLSRTETQAVIRIVREFANPDNFSGDKTEKRDFHNWKNEAQQTFELLGQTVFFEYRDKEKLLLANDAHAPTTSVRLKRSMEQKAEYFRKHRASKTVGFELHHVVSLGSAQSLEHFKELDSWKNLLYVDAFSHAKISQRGNRHVKMEIQKNERVIRLEALGNASDCVELKDHTNLKFDFNLSKTIQDYNFKLNNV